jgi:hypothetical protein
MPQESERQPADRSEHWAAQRADQSAISVSERILRTRVCVVHLALTMDDLEQRSEQQPADGTDRRAVQWAEHSAKSASQLCGVLSTFDADLDDLNRDLRGNQLTEVSAGLFEGLNNLEYL